MGIKNCLKFVTRDIVKNCQNAKATYVCYSIHLSLDIFLFVELFRSARTSSGGSVCLFVCSTIEADLVDFRTCFI